MNIKDWFRNFRQTFAGSAAAAGAPATRSTSFANAWLRGQEDTPTAPVMLSSAFQQSTWVYACVTTLAENLSAIPFRIPGDGSGSGADAAARLFAQPHRHMDRFAFWELVVQWLCLRGEAFIYPVLEGRAMEGRAMEGRATRVPDSAMRVPDSLLILNPDHMREVIIGHELGGWNFTGSGANSPIPSMVLLPEEVIHIRLPNPFHLWRGMSPLTVAWLAAQTDYAAAQFMKGAMINNADTGLIISLPEQPEPEQREQLLAALRERKRAAGTADRPLVLFDGAKIEKPTVTAMELEFLENRKFNRQEICAIYKVPQELLGYTEDANRSVSEAARLNFVENRIAPLCKRLEAGIDPIVKLFGRQLRGEFHVNATPIMQAAQRARIDSGLKLFGVGVPLNVVNQVLDLGLPELAHGDRTFLSSRYNELDAKPSSARSFQDGGCVACEQPERVGASGVLRLVEDDTAAVRSRTSRHIFEQRSSVLAALANAREQLESGVVPELDVPDRLKAELHAVIADAIYRKEPYELITRRVRAYFNQVGSARCADRGHRSAAPLPNQQTTTDN